MTRQLFAAITAIALGSLCAPPVLHASHYPGHFLVGSSLYDNLSRLTNRPVRLIIKGGGEVRGVVREVGVHVVRLDGHDGEEILVAADQIAVLITEKGQP